MARCVVSWLRVVAIVTAVALVACGEYTPRGHGGTFLVHAAMMQNTCGPQAINFTSSVTFQARIAYDRGISTWSVPSSGASATGSWTDAPPSFRIQMDTYATVRAADRRLGLGACVLHRFDQIDGTLSTALPDLAVRSDGSVTIDALSSLDATSPLVPDAGPTTLAATETIVIGVADGADCRDRIGSGTGQFLTLPCEVTYAMSGTLAE